jgi:hypothetical protein
MPGMEAEDRLFATDSFDIICKVTANPCPPTPLI